MKRPGFQERFVDGSQRLPRSAVVWSRTVTRSSSSFAGSPVNSSAGRTLAAIPKSVIQISPGLTAGIVVLHAVEHHCPFHSGLIAERHIGILIGDFEKHLADGSPISLGEPGKFPDDFSCAHAANLVADRGIVIRQIAA